MAERAGHGGHPPLRPLVVPALARNRRMHIVVGKAMQLPLLEAPTKEQVAEHHARYVAALTRSVPEGAPTATPDVQLEVGVSLGSFRLSDGWATDKWNRP